MGWRCLGLGILAEGLGLRARGNKTWGKGFRVWGVRISTLNTKPLGVVDQPFADGCCPQELLHYPKLTKDHSLFQYLRLKVWVPSMGPCAFKRVSGDPSGYILGYLTGI